MNARRLFLALALALAVTAGGYLSGPLRSPDEPAAAPAAATPPPAAPLDVGGPGDGAVAALRTRVEQNPRDGEALAGLGAAYLQRVRETSDFSYLPRAETLLHRALAVDSQDPIALLSLSSLAGTRHRFGEALALGRRARAAAPGSARTEGAIADALSELGRYDASFAATQRMVDLRPDLASYSRVALARFLDGDGDGAVAAMRLAVEAGAGAPEHMAWTSAQLGQLLFKLGRLGPAEDAFQRSLTALPGYHRALAGLAQVRAAQGRTAEAIRLATRAVDRVPSPEYLVLLGDLYAVSARPQLAAQQYDLVRVEQALFRRSGGRPDLELALFEAAHGRPAQAVAMARRALPLRPSIQAEDALGFALTRAGRCAEALRHARRAVRLGTPDPALHWHAALAATCAGRPGEAKAHLRRVLALNPRYAPLEAREIARLAQELGGLR